MSDDETHGDEGPASDTESERDPMSPGGGPRRVVSDQGVDDILESIDSMSEPDSDSDSDPVPGPDSDSDSDLDPDPDRSDARGDDTDTASTPADANAVSPSDVDTAADDLADRIERGEVTGADVRSAEAGTGRESTPAVDEIDLSLEDLDESAEGTTDPDATAGPPATGDEGATAGAEDDDSTDADGDAAGLLGRLRQLFSL